MKKILLILSLITGSLNAQENATVDLKWKISDTLSYKTFMYGYSVKEKIQEAKNETNPERKEKLLKDIELVKMDYETHLFPDNKGNIDIKMLFIRDNKKDDDVVLRGKMTPEGEILSFYYKQEKKNLVSLFFQLPGKPVKIGDEWNIDVDMITLDQHFKADSLYKKNTVRLKDIIERNGNKIAIIEYDLNEFVSGTYEKNKLKNPKQNEPSEKPYLKAIHRIIGEFNIDKGIWISYDGYRETKGNISVWGMNNNQKVVFQLILKQ